MATTPLIIRKDLAARLVAASLREATGPLGAANEAATVIDRSFDVQMGDDQDAGQRVRMGVTMQIVQGITVRLAHRVKPGKAGDARDASLSDRTAVLRAFLTRTAATDPRAATAAEYESTLHYRGGSTEERGGGAFLLTTMQLDVTYQLDLTAGVA